MEASTALALVDTSANVQLAAATGDAQYRLCLFVDVKSDKNSGMIGAYSTTPQSRRHSGSSAFAQEKSAAPKCLALCCSPPLVRTEDFTTQPDPINREAGGSRSVVSRKTEFPSGIDRTLCQHRNDPRIIGFRPVRLPMLSSATS
jgi:hypothetical protein